MYSDSNQHGSVISRGFTLVELILVIVILGFLSAIAVPRLFDTSVDAKTATCKADLAAMREGISAFHLNSSLSGPHAFPTLAQMRTAGTVMEVIPENPFCTAASGACAGSRPGAAIAPGSIKGVPVTPGTSGGWCYKASTGEIWANTASGAGEAGF